MGNGSRKPALSIVTITYNAPRSLLDTLRSLTVLPGSDLYWELVVVDSSPAENASVLQAFSGALPLRRLEQAPQGIYPAQNAGLAAAKGELVWFLNGGDRLSSAPALSRAVQKLQAATAAELLIAAADLYHGETFSRTQHPRAGLAPMLGINRVCHQSVLYRRSLFGRLGPFRAAYRIAADYELHLRALAEGVNVILLDEAIVKYDMDGQSADFEAAIDEFAAVQRELRAMGKLPLAWLHSVVRKLERRRIGISKRLGLRQQLQKIRG